MKEVHRDPTRQQRETPLPRSHLHTRNWAEEYEEPIRNGLLTECNLGVTRVKDLAAVSGPVSCPSRSHR